MMCHRFVCTVYLVKWNQFSDSWLLFDVLDDFSLVWNHHRVLWGYAGHRRSVSSGGSSAYISYLLKHLYFFGGGGVIYADDTVMEAYYGGDLNIQPSACTLANNIILYNIAVVKGKFDYIKIVTDIIVVWLLVP